MAVGATTLAATDIAGIAEIRDGEQAPAVQAPTERHREKIADFLSVAANVDLQKGPAVETDGGSGQMQRQEVGKILRGRYRGLGFGENQNPGTQLYVAALVISMPIQSTLQPFDLWIVAIPVRLTNLPARA